MPLNLLTDAQAGEYIASLDLAKGSEAHRTVGAMMVLPSDAFLRAVSALSQGLINFAAIRSLPAMNARLIDALISAQLGQEDSTTLAWRYREEWLPASVDVAAMRAEAIGSARDALAARYIDRWGGVIRPPYDFLRTDEKKYHTYNEAYIAYMIIASDTEVAGAVETFRGVHALARADSPEVIQPAGECPILAAVESLATSPLFLEQASGGRPAAPLLDWIMSGSWRHVEPGNYSRFMDEVAYPAMAASDDPGREGLAGAVAVRDAHPWAPIDPSAPGWALDRTRMARVHLPGAYSTRVTGPSELLAERATASAVLAYLGAAREAITLAHDALLGKLTADASVYRAPVGSPIGLLIALTLTN